MLIRIIGIVMSLLIMNEGSACSRRACNANKMESEYILTAIKIEDELYKELESVKSLKLLETSMVNKLLCDWINTLNEFKKKDYDEYRRSGGVQSEGRAENLKEVCLALYKVNNLQKGKALPENIISTLAEEYKYYSYVMENLFLEANEVLKKHGQQIPGIGK